MLGVREWIRGECLSRGCADTSGQINRVLSATGEGSRI